jgi:hypothetical protein
VRAPTCLSATPLRMLAVLALALGLSACGGDKKQEQKAQAPGVAPTPSGETSISGTIALDPALKDKVGKAPLLMIIASTSSDSSKPALVVKREADASFPYDYKLTAEDITLVGSSFRGKMYVTARIDSAGMVGPPRPGTFEGTYPGNPVQVGSSKVDIVINKTY